MSASGNWGSFSGNCNIATVGSDLILSCLGSGTFTPAFNTTCRVLIVAGGGAGGGSYYWAGNDGPGAGGGAGGQVRDMSGITLTQSTEYNIVVGAGGTTNGASAGNAGGNSSAFGYTSVGGLGGYNNRDVHPGQGGDQTGAGFTGGLRNESNVSGGGAGAGENGQTGDRSTRGGGRGGNGVYSDITGSNIGYGGGGGGGGPRQYMSYWRGGYGATTFGGGNGHGYNGSSSDPTSDHDGYANRGGGGGGARAYEEGGASSGSPGGSGVVIIRIVNGANPTSIPTVATSKTTIGGVDYNSFDAVSGTQRVLTVNTNRNSTTYTHDLYLQDANGNDLFAIGSNIASSVSINLTEAQQELIVNSIGANTGTPNWRTLKSANFRVRMYNNQLTQNTYSAYFAYNYLPCSFTKDRTSISQVNKTVTLIGGGDGIADTNIQVQLRDNTTVLDQAGRKNSNASFNQALSLTDGQIATIEQSIPNTPNKTLNLYAYMQVDDTVYKTYQENLTYTCDNSTNLYTPDVGTFNLIDTIMDGIVGEDYLIAGLSSVSAVISDLGTAKRYATISANWVSGDSKNTGEKTETGTYEVGLVSENLNYQSEPLNLNYTLSTRDSRGFISTDVITKQVIPYKAQNQNFSYSRENDFGDITTINLDGFYTKITTDYGGSGLNLAPILTYKWRKKGEETWSSPLTGTIIDGILTNFKQAYTSEFAINLDSNYQWELEVTFEDDVQAISWIWDIDSGKSLFQIRPDGTGAGMSKGAIFTYGKLEHGLGFDSFQSEEFSVTATPYKILLGSFNRYGKIEVEINTPDGQFLGEVIYSAQGLKQDFICQGEALKFWYGPDGLYVGIKESITDTKQFNVTVWHDGCFNTLELGGVSFSTNSNDFTAINPVNFGNASELVTQATFIYDSTHTNAYTGSLPDPILAYKTGMKIDLLVSNSNTDVATLNIDGLGAKSIKKNGTESLSAGDITLGKIIPLVYDGTNFQIVGGGGIELLDVYPVGAIYMSVVNTNPSSLFGGTWVAWGSGRVPVGVDTGQTEFDTVEETGGAKTHTLTSAESGLKDHTHNIGANNTGGYVPNGLTPNAFIYGSFGNGDQKNGYPTDRAVTNVLGSGLVQGVAGGASNASSAHNNLQPYITCYMFKRTV
ncbi:MAG: hypothetical protein PHE32_04195 [Candidatus Shapirobacteria bacterium]|nr:hypothetical protein [Candidatus Shapirobacteria bacterium]